jgi:hypothetical protein
VLIWGPDVCVVDNEVLSVTKTRHMVGSL